MISISQAKQIRELLGMTHVVIFGIAEDGNYHIATHGLTNRNAIEAADAGNRLKKHLGWPAELCNAKPLPRICENCQYFEPDYGYYCFNGWSKDGTTGSCQLEPSPIEKKETSRCRYFEPRC